MQILTSPFSSLGYGGMLEVCQNSVLYISASYVFDKMGIAGNDNKLLPYTVISGMVAVFGKTALVYLLRRRSDSR